MSASDRSAFTLVELLVTTSLMALVGGVTVAALAGGLRVWERSHEASVNQHAVLVALDGLRKDVRALRQFRLVPFDGAYDHFEAAAVGRVDPDGDGPEELGRLGYFLEERRRLLCRSFVPYRLVKRQRLTDRCEIVLEDVTRIRVSYFGTDEDSGQTGWFEHWHSTAPPMALKGEVVTRTPHHAAVSQGFLVYLMGAAQAKSEQASQK